MKFLGVLLILNLVTVYLSNAKPARSCDHPADIVFVLDSSSSIYQLDFVKQISFVKDLVNNFNVGTGATQTQVGVVTFGESPWLKFPLNKFTDQESLQNAIGNVQYRPGYKTKTDTALTFVTNNMFTSRFGSRPDVDHIAIVITDGKSTESEKTRAAAAEARGAGIQIYAIGVGPNFSLDELHDIASDPDDQHVFTVNSYSALQSIMTDLVGSTCEVTTTTTVPTTTTTTTVVTTSTTPIPTTATTTEPTTTEAPQQDTLVCSGKPADVYFVMDSSGSIGWKNYKIQKTFVKNLVSDFVLKHNETRIGLVIFSESHKLSIPLGSASNKQQLLSSIDRLPYLRRGTNTGAAIQFVRENGFSNGLGRPDAEKVVILLTDGLSRDPQDTRQQSTLARESGISMFAIGIGSGVDMQELRDIASQPGSKYVFHVERFEALKDIEASVATRTCQVSPNEQSITSVTATTTTRVAPTTASSSPSTSVSTNQSLTSTTTVPTTTTTTVVTTSTTPIPTTTTEPTTTEVPQQDTLVCSGKPADVYFVMDSSGSIGWKNYKIQKTFVKNLVSDFVLKHNETRIGLVIFSENHKLSIPLGSASNKQQLLSSIDRLPYLRRGTNTGAAIQFVRENGFSNGLGRPDAEKVVILLTDGLSRDPQDTRQQSTLARESGISMFAIGIGKGVDMQELRDIASQPASKYVFHVERFEALKDIEASVATRTCQVSPNEQSTSTTTRTTSIPITTEPTTTETPQQDILECNGKPTDLYFVIDSSGSIGWKNYKIQKTFVKNLVRDFGVKHNETRIGLVIFSESYKLSIPLGSASDVQQLLLAIDRLPYLRRGTNTGAAIQFVRERGFSNGIARPFAEKVVILLTDGLSRNPLDTKRQSTQARESGIKMFAIGIGKGVDMQELNDIASQPASKYVFHVDRFEALKDIEASIVTRTCHIVTPNDQATCSPNYLLDLMFVFDSFSLGAVKSKVVSTFVSTISQSMDTTSGKVRIGRLVDNCPDEGDLPLSSGSLSNLENIIYPDMYNIITKLQTSAFSALNGGRAEAKSSSVIFLDCDSDDIENTLSDIADITDMDISVILVGNPKDINISIGEHTLYRVDSYQHLSQFTATFLRSFCSQITL